MSCCNQNCQQGRDCPANQGLTDAIFVGTVYAIAGVGLVAIAWAVAYVLANIIIAGATP